MSEKDACAEIGIECCGVVVNADIAFEDDFVTL